MTTEPQHSFIDFLKRDKQIMRNLCCMIIIWSTLSFCHYLLQYDIKYIKGDFYTNGLASTGAEVIASAFSGALMGVFGIKKVLRMNFVMAFTGMLVLIIS